MYFLDSEDISHILPCTTGTMGKICKSVAVYRHVDPCLSVHVEGVEPDTEISDILDVLYMTTKLRTLEPAHNMKEVMSLLSKYPDATCLKMPPWMTGEEKSELHRKNINILTESDIDNLPQSTVENMNHAFRQGNINYALWILYDNYADVYPDVETLRFTRPGLVSISTTCRVLDKAMCSVILEAYPTDEYRNDLKFLGVHLNDTGVFVHHIQIRSFIDHEDEDLIRESNRVDSAIQMLNMVTPTSSILRMIWKSPLDDAVMYKALQMSSYHVIEESMCSEEYKSKLIDLGVVFDENSHVVRLNDTRPKFIPRSAWVK